MSTHPSSHRIPVAADAAIFTIRKDELCILLIQMKKDPFKDQWALPGGLLEGNETSKEAVERILRDQTGVTDAYLEQLMTFDDPTRDPLGRVVSIAYFALVPFEKITLKTTEKYGDIRWWPIKKLPTLAYDHASITKVAVDRLRAKLEYANVAWSLLPHEFPLRLLQQTYEVILGKPLDKRNFLKKVLMLGLLEPTGKKEGGAHRPAMLYRFKRRKAGVISLL